MEKDLLVSRSFSACIKAAYVLITTNIKTVVRKTWLAALILSIALTFNVLLMVPDMNIAALGLSHPWAVLALTIVAFIVFFAASLWMLSLTVSMLNGQPMKSNLLRSLIILAIEFVIFGIAIICFYVGTTHLLAGTAATTESAATASSGWTSPLLIGLSILIIAFTLPCGYSFLSYLIDPNTSFKRVFGHDYKIGFKHWGFLFIVFFITLIILSVIAIVIMVPFISILLAQISNQLGMLGGDPNGAPSYLYGLLVVTTILTMFLLLYVVMWLFFVNYYAYGSITKQEQERKERKIQLSKDETSTDIIH